MREAIRYKGQLGHYSWIAHRLSGLAILSFLIIHVWDTANATFAPDVYVYVVEIFKWLPFSLGEIGLMAAVLFHSFNGLRITVLDWKPELWEQQEKSTKITWGVFLVVFIPLALLMLISTIGHCQTAAEHGGSCLAFPAPPADMDVNFASIGGVITALILTGVISFATANKGETTKKARPQRSDFERRAYTFMRVSGVFLLFLAVGHMFLQHIIRDVHDLNLQVVIDAWRSWGWRAYDLLLLIFAVAHGFNGLRNVLTDYIHSTKTLNIINRALAIFVVLTILWSAIAIFSFNPDAVMVAAP